MDRGLDIVAPECKNKLIKLLCRHFCVRIITHESAMRYCSLLRSKVMTFTFRVRLSLIPIESCREDVQIMSKSSLSTDSHILDVRFYTSLQSNIRNETDNNVSHLPVRKYDCVSSKRIFIWSVLVTAHKTSNGLTFPFKTIAKVKIALLSNQHQVDRIR